MSGLDWEGRATTPRPYGTGRLFAFEGRLGGVVVRVPAFVFEGRAFVFVFSVRRAFAFVLPLEFLLFALPLFAFLLLFELSAAFEFAEAFEFVLPFAFLFVGLRRFEFVLRFSSKPSVPRSVFLSSATASSGGFSPSFGARLTTTATVCPS